MRCVRNFWLEANVDGRDSSVGTGPRAKDGGMRITIYQRNDGQVDEALSVRCQAAGTKLITRISIPGKEMIIVETER